MNNASKLEEEYEQGLRKGTYLRTNLLSSSGVQSICALAASATSLLTLVVWLGALPTSSSFSPLLSGAISFRLSSDMIGKGCAAQMGTVQVCRNSSHKGH